METMDHFIARLQHVTRDCRRDMHQTEDQGLGGVILGDHLDNACPANPKQHCNEYIIRLTGPDGQHEYFNIADMIAVLRVCGSRPSLRKRPS